MFTQSFPKQSGLTLQVLHSLTLVWVKEEPSGTVIILFHSQDQGNPFLGAEFWEPRELSVLLVPWEVALGQLQEWGMIQFSPRDVKEPNTCSLSLKPPQKNQLEGPALQSGGLSCTPWCWHPIWVPVPVPAAPLLIQMARVFEPLQPCKRPEGNSSLLARTWLLQPCGEWANRWEHFFLSLCNSLKPINLKNEQTKNLISLKAKFPSFLKSSPLG